MVERKLRPAPSTLHLLPSRKPVKTGGAAASKLFVLDTNVLMHDPTSLFRFEEHDIYLPMLTLEELDNNKKGVTEVARNARQVSRFLDELVTAHGETGESIAKGIPLEAKSNGAATGRLFLQTESDRHRAAALARERQGRQPDPRASSCTSQQHAPEAQRHPGVEGHQHAHQGARARHRRRGLLQRQGPRGHRAPLLGHARAARRLLGPHGKGMESWQQGGHTLLPPHRAAGRRRCSPTSSSTRRSTDEAPFYAIVKEIHGQDRRSCPRSRTTRTRRTTCGASRRATASRTSRSTCS